MGAFRPLREVKVLTGFDHVTIAVDDIERATEQYAHLLGTVPSWRGEHPGLGARGALFALANIALELVAPAKDAEESEGLRVRLQERGEGLVALAFCVSDAARFSQAARAQGLRTTLPEDGEARSESGAVRRYRSVELSPRCTRGLSVLAVERPTLDALRAPELPREDCVHALDHIVLRSADLDAAVALYAQRLGLRLALDTVIAGTRMLFFRSFGVTLEVVHDPSATEDVLHGLAYRVRALEATHARLSGAGVTLDPCRAGRKPGTRVFSAKQGSCGVPTLFLSDPARDGAAEDRR